MFAPNVPPLERLIRLLFGLTIAAWALFGLAQASLVLVALGLCVAASGLVGFCPACALVGRRPAQRR